MIQILLYSLLYQVKTTCNFQSFDQAQLKSDNFYEKLDYTRQNLYAFGVWTMYAPLRNNFYYDSSKSYYDQKGPDDGYHILNFQSDGNIQTLYFLKPVHFNLNSPYPQQIIRQWTKTGVVSYTFSYHPYYYEGYWVFTYFGFQYSNKYNFATYSTGEDWFSNFLVTTKILQTQTTNAKLEFGGQGQYKISTTTLNLYLYPGRMSIVTIIDSPQFFSNSNKAGFLTYINNCYIPAPCQQTQQITILDQPYSFFNLTLRQFKVDVPAYRLYIEFWIRRDPLIEVSILEHIFSYGARFQSQDINTKLFLFCKPYLNKMIFSNIITSFYVIPTIDYQDYIINDQSEQLISFQDLSNWNYFRYEFDRQDTNELIVFSHYQQIDGLFEQITLFDFSGQFQYSNYQAIVSIFTDTIEAGVGQFASFQGDIANFRINYCYSGDLVFSVDSNLNCHESCKTCNGPTQWNCLTCYNEQNRQLQPDLHMCLCFFDYQDVSLICLQKKYDVTSVSLAIPLDHFQCNFGYFEAWGDGVFLGCIACPNSNDHQVRCLNCLLNSQTWYQDPICNLNYVSTDNTYFSFKIDDDFDYYVIDYNSMSVDLCKGCASYNNKQYECKINTYRFDNNCIPCGKDCLECNKQNCIKCQNGYYLLDNSCIVCSPYCTSCEIWQDSVVCTHCSQEWTLFNGDCVKCGINCENCEIRYINKLYYRKCLNCLQDTYISLDGESCYFNTVEYCQYPFQFSNQNKSLATFKYDFEPELVQFIQTGCVFCEAHAYLKISDDFSCDPMGYYVIGNGCAQSVDIDNSYFCMMGIGDLLVIGKTYCTQFLTFCLYCVNMDSEYFKACLICTVGYYTDYYTTYCKPCPVQCLSCYQTDSSKINKPSILFSMIIPFEFDLQSFYQQTQDPDKNNVQLLCTKCADGYTLYKDSCIENCPSNCKECIIKNNKQICVSCLVLTKYSHFSIQDGVCIACPTNCKLCKLRTEQEIKSINPYFEHEKFQLYSNPCVQPLDKDLFYDQDIKQFITCSECQKIATLEINVYCTPQASDLFNIQFDQLFNTDPLNYLSLIETEDYYLYLNTEYVKYINYKFTFQPNSVCIINSNNYFSSSLQKNVFNILAIDLEINGNNSTIIFNGNATISNFSSISIKNINLQNGGFIITNIKEQSVILESISITSYKLNLITINAFQLFNVSSVHMNEIIISNINSNTTGSIIVISNQISSIKFVMNHFTISNSNFIAVNGLQFLSNQIAITMTDILILKSRLTEFKLFDISNQTTLQLDMLIIQDVTIKNSNNFLQLTNSAKINQILVINTKIHNTFLIVINQKVELLNSLFENLFIYGTSSLLSTSSNLDNQLIFLTNVKFTNIIYEAKQAIMFIKKSNKYLLTVNFTQIELVKVSINLDLLISYQQSKELSSIYIEADVVQFEDVSIQRGIGYSEFTLTNVKSFNFINSFISLEETYYFKSIQKIDCLLSNNNLMYGSMMFLLDIGETTFTSINISNIILYNSVLIDYLVTSDLQKPSFNMLNCTWSNNIIHITTTQAKISLLQVSSPLALLIITLKSNWYFSNLLDTEIENTSSQQGLLFTINSEEAIIKDCQFKSNIIINGSSSILVINSDTIKIEGTEFYNNSIFQFDTIKQFLTWSFESEVFQEDLEKVYPVTSIGGNGNLQARIVHILNSTVANSYSKYGAAFKIDLKGNGAFLVLRCQFSNLRTEMSDISKGGCFHISSYSSSLEIHFADSTFSSISSRQFGGLLYLQTSTKQSTISFNNLSFRNIYSLQGSLVYIEQQQQGNSYFTMINCNCENEEFQFQSFINSIQNVTSSEFTILIEFFSLVYFMRGSIQISNLTISQYPYLQVFYFQNSVLIKNIKILNTSFTRPLIVFNKNQDPIQIQISGLDLFNCSLIGALPVQTINEMSIQQILLPSCQTYQLPEYIQLARYQTSNNNFNVLSKLLFESSIQSVIQFNNFQQEDNIKLKFINLNIECNRCQSGALGLLNFNSPVVAIEDLIISDSKCGTNGCLFISSSQQRLLSSVEFSNRTSIRIRNLLCSNNYAKFGGCLYLKQQKIQILYSLMISNSAEKGGAIYIQGAGSVIDAVQLSLFNNSAIEGSGLYANQLFFYSHNGITYQDNQGAVTKQQPSKLIVQIFSNLTLEPKTIYQDQYHQVNKIISSDGEEVILYLPTGVKVQKYRRFDMKQNAYSKQQQLLRLMAFADQTQIIDLEETYCTCEILTSNGTKTKNLTSQTNFYFKESSYSFDDLILYLPQNSSQKFWLQFWCNSIHIPIFESNQIIGFHQNYTLLLQVKPYQCQLGEYHVGEEDYCHPCKVDTQLYSVTVNSTSCLVKNEQKIREITAAQLNLNQGYWRYRVTSQNIDFCFNKEENCIGGWSVGDNLCIEGNIGGLCEQCDYYNIRGQGHYQRLREFECQLCQQGGINSNLIMLILTLLIFTFLFIYLNKLQQNRERNILNFQISRVYQMKFREVTSGQSIKIIIQFFQVISLTTELQPIYTEVVQTVIDHFGNPFQLLTLFNICTLIDIDINIVYMDLLQNSIFLLMIATIFLVICFCLLLLTRWKFRSTFINFVYIYYIFFQSSVIRSNLKLISERSLQGEIWIYQNVAYLYNTNTHLKFVFACVLPILVALIIVVPIFLYIKLREYTKDMRRKTFRDFGFWFTAQNEYHWEAVKIIYLIVTQTCIVSIDGDISLRCLFVIVVIIIYRKLFTSSTVYFNIQLNQLEYNLIGVSFCILILSTFHSIMDINIFKQLTEFLLYLAFAFSWVQIIHSLYKFNIQVFKQLIQSIVGYAIDSYPQFIEYNICYKFSKTSTQNCQRRLQLLRGYLLMKGRIAFYKKIELKETISI